MYCLQHVFQRGALALGLLTVGIGLGYGLHQPGAALAPVCRPASQHALSALPIAGPAYPPASGDSSSRNTDQAACSCGNA